MSIQNATSATAELSLVVLLFMKWFLLWCLVICSMYCR